MIAHLVLFQPRADLTRAQRLEFTAALEAALSGIPSIVRFSLGRRLLAGAPYDAGTPPFGFVGIFEFADEGGLREYLAHPVHRDIGRLFHSCSSAALALDFSMASGEQARAAVSRLVDP